MKGLFVRRRGPPQDAGHDDLPFLEVGIEDDPVVAHAPAPRGKLPLEALQIALEGIRLH